MTVSFKQFQDMDLRVARIESVRDHPNADKLYLLDVTDGTERRQLVAGIKPHYEPESLEGREVVVLWNLDPATIRGERSEGMLLAADAGDVVSIVAPDRTVPPGSRIR